MRLIPPIRFNVDVAAPIDIGMAPAGQRRMANIPGGRFDGERLAGRIHASGAHWIRVGQTGMGHGDVRIVLETVDGADVCVAYSGFLEMNARRGEVVASRGQTQVGDLYLVTHLRFETGDPRYGWLNHTLAAGEGRAAPGGIE